MGNALDARLAEQAIAALQDRERPCDVNRVFPTQIDGLDEVRSIEGGSDLGRDFNIGSPRPCRLNPRVGFGSLSKCRVDSRGLGVEIEGLKNGPTIRPNGPGWLSWS